MAEQFACPSCGAPLDYDGSGNASMRCPFCNNTVVVPEALRTVRPAAPPVAPPSTAEEAVELLARIQDANKHLLQTGLQAKAKVLQYSLMRFDKMVPTGLTEKLQLDAIRRYVAVTLTVEVHPTSGPAFTAQAQGEFFETKVPNYQPGQMVTVRYDPYDLRRVGLEGA